MNDAKYIKHENRYVALLISRGGRYNDTEVDEVFWDSPEVHVSFSNCWFEPYSSKDTSCWPNNIERARRIYKGYVDFLDELGVSENEAIIFSEWFEEEIKRKITSKEWE